MQAGAGAGPARGTPPPPAAWRALGVAVNEVSSREEARKAFRRAAKERHPDGVVARLPPGCGQEEVEAARAEAERHFVAMQKAYEDIAAYCDAFGGEGPEQARRRVMDDALNRARVASQLAGLGRRRGVDEGAGAPEEAPDAESETDLDRARLGAQLAQLSSRQRRGRRRRPNDGGCGSVAFDVDETDDGAWFHGVQ